MANFSIVHWYPELEKHKCGYCKQLNTNCSYGKKYFKDLFNLSNKEPYFSFHFLNFNSLF